MPGEQRTLNDGCSFGFVIGPICACGGTIRARSTMPGVPFSSRQETSAHHAKLGDDGCFVQFRVVAHGFRGGFHRFLVARAEARNACCTRLPSWPAPCPARRRDSA